MKTSKQRAQNFPIPFSVLPCSLTFLLRSCFLRRTISSFLLGMVVGRDEEVMKVLIFGDSHPARCLRGSATFHHLLVEAAFLFLWTGGHTPACSSASGRAW